MATITKFDDLEVWQLAIGQANDFFPLVQSAPLAWDYELGNRMNASPGSVMDCVAEEFESSGNKGFRNFMVMGKGSNGERRSQLYRRVDRFYLSKEKFVELYGKNITIANKPMS